MADAGLGAVDTRLPGQFSKQAAPEPWEHALAGGISGAIGGGLFTGILGAIIAKKGERMKGFWRGAGLGALASGAVGAATGYYAGNVIDSLSERKPKTEQDKLLDQLATETDSKKIRSLMDQLAKGYKEPTHDPDAQKLIDRSTKDVGKPPARVDRYAVGQGGYYVPDQDSVHYDGNSKHGPTILAHELGHRSSVHADSPTKTIDGALYGSPAYRIAAALTQSAGAGGALYLALGGKKRRRLAQALVGAGLLSTAPMLINEARASIRGAEKLKELNIPQTTSMVPAYGTYALSAASPLLTAGAVYGGRKLFGVPDAQDDEVEAEPKKKKKPEFGSNPFLYQALA